MYFQKIRRISVVVTSSNMKPNWRKAPFLIGKAQDELHHINRNRAERR